MIENTEDVQVDESIDGVLGSDDNCHPLDGPMAHPEQLEILHIQAEIDLMQAEIESHSTQDELMRAKTHFWRATANCIAANTPAIKKIFDEIVAGIERKLKD